MVYATASAGELTGKRDVMRKPTLFSQAESDSIEKWATATTPPISPWWFAPFSLTLDDAKP
jgi:hypothetical protein